MPFPNSPAWATPKVDWDTDDGFRAADMNQVESNILGLGNWFNQGGQFEVDTVDFPNSTEERFTIVWQKYAHSFVLLRLPIVLSQVLSSARQKWKLAPVTAWPTEILVESSEIFTPCLIASYDGGSGHDYVHPGCFECPYHSTTEIQIFSTLDETGASMNFGFTVEQIISYAAIDEPTS